ncbi:MAG TPA: urate hydroxylase PuuD, partial [Candidatus Acidoferrales bacterium]|nr:urate hydroxylase PuuD [Candidatus Acidoferrales bacterium]
LLLGIVYYMGGALVDPDVAQWTPWQATGIGLGAIIAGWVVYDLLWSSPLAKHETLGAVISYALIVAAAYGLSRVFSGRGAYIHVGAILGTLMTLNVWMRILPAQKKMVAALAAGRAPDLTLGARAKQRSKHNTFMVVPVVFTMISNHFPIATYGDKYAWIILVVLVLVGWGAAAAIRRA